MPLIKVKTKHQITLPVSLRQQVGVSVGDILEANLEKGKITLTPKKLIDRELALALEDIKAGRVFGPFNSAEAMLKHLRRK